MITSYRKLIYSILGILALIALVVFLASVQTKDESLKIIFLDVGQGDSILITDGSRQILIDGGKDGTLLLEKLGRYVPFWDRTIETVIETHPDRFWWTPVWCL